MPTVAKKEGRDEGEDAIPEVGATSHRLVDDAVAVEALRMQLDELAREVDLGLEEAEAEAGAIRTSVRGPNQPTHRQRWCAMTEARSEHIRASCTRVCVLRSAFIQ